MSDKNAELTHEDCLDRHDGSCEGDVSYFPTIPARWRLDGAAIVFPRCEKHYEEYEHRCDERINRERKFEASLYCKHGTFIGDPYGPDYLCGACESE